MTSEQQVKSMYNDCKVLEIEECYFIQVTVSGINFLIGMGTSRYKAFTDAMHKLGIKTVFWNGNYQKHRLQKQRV